MLLLPTLLDCSVADGGKGMEDSDETEVAPSPVELLAVDRAPDHEEEGGPPAERIEEEAYGLEDLVAIEGELLSPTDVNAVTDHTKAAHEGEDDKHCESLPSTNPLAMSSVTQNTATLHTFQGEWHLMFGHQNAHTKKKSELSPEKEKQFQGCHVLLSFYW